MKEAGYKETRVFTPESERAEARAEEQRSLRSGSIRGGVDAVVGFLAGFMPGAARSEDNSDSLNTSSSVEDSMPASGRRSLPASPLAHKHPQTADSLSPAMTTIRYSSASPRAHVQQLSNHSLPHPTRQTLRHQPSASSSLRTYVQVTAARGHLRHMASAPNIPKRTASSRESFSRRKTVVGNTDYEDIPSLPINWRGNVTKAVLGSTSSDAYIGGPSSRPLSRHSHHTTRSSRPPTVFSDHTNRLNMKNNRNTSSSLAPHNLTSYLQRAQTAPNEVTTVRVVCRSAPASRSSSRAGERLSRTADRGLRMMPSRKSKGNKPDCVPSLADTQLENDIWEVQWVNGMRLPASSADNYEAELTDSDDDEGELDLARLLVPPKRQNSIRSLRRHLHRSESVRALRNRASRALNSWAFEDDEDGPSSTRASVRGRSRRASMEEGDEYGYEAIGLPGFDQVGGKRRRGIPGVWSLGGR